MRSTSIIHAARATGWALAACLLLFCSRAGAQIPCEELVPDAGPACWFGQAVALSDNTAVVGASHDSTAGTACGALYVYAKVAGVWTRQAKLTPDDAVPGDFIGISVAISGDTIVAGARTPLPIHDALRQTADGATTCGAVYVFTRSGGAWSQQAKLTVDGMVAWDEFASSVAISGDTVFVGAPESSTGTVYAFTRAGATWTAKGALAVSGLHAQDEFGWSMAASSGTLVVGAPGVSAEKVGAAYVFALEGGTWVQQARLSASDAAQGDEGFGYAVAVSGDTVVIGAEGFEGHADPPIYSAGSAYVFTRSGGVWSQQARLNSPEPGGLCRFGYSVAVHGDTAVIAEKWANVGTILHAGAGHLFSRRNGTWTWSARLVAPDAAQYDRIGDSVAVSNDTVIVGGSSHKFGAAYLFTLPDQTHLQGPGNAWALY